MEKPEGGRIDGKLFWQSAKENGHRISCGQSGGSPNRRAPGELCIPVTPIMAGRIAAISEIERARPMGLSSAHRYGHYAMSTEYGRGAVDAATPAIHTGRCVAR
ncbi:unnamed protein product, partial [Iphiclides podalirius]